MNRDFRRIAIVNRGEPGVRLIRAVRDLEAERGEGLTTIALYTDADRDSLYVRNADVTDPTLSPEGHSALYVLAPVPNLRGAMDWETATESFRELTLDTARRRQFAEAAEVSLRRQEEMERRDDLSFAEYLARYFAQ